MRHSLLLLSLLFFRCSDKSDPIFHPSTMAESEAPSPFQFERLSPERTGIQFVPRVKDEYRYNFLQDPYIYNGGGVAVLDVNHDGLQDLLFTARLQGCRLYLNKGGMAFQDISGASGIEKFGGLKTGVVVVDINQDGWDDLYVCRTWLEPVPERRNLLFVNNKDNTFSEKAADYGLDDISASQQAVFWDYDLDGDLDCYVVNHPVDFKNMNNLDYSAGNAYNQPPRNEWESDRLYRNNGATNPKFTDVTKTAGLWNRAYGLSCVVHDFNEDGWPDLFVGNDFIMPDFLYINNRNGTFSNQASAWFSHQSNHTMGADVGDLDNDGVGDLVTLDMLAEDWQRRQGLMSTMQLERDKRMIQLGYGNQVMRNTMHLMPGGSGRKSAEIACLTGTYATDWSWAPLIIDLDNDGWRDLFISNGIKRDLNDLDFFLYTADSINRTGGVDPKRFAQFETFAAMIPSQPTHNYLFQNKGNLSFREVSAKSGLDQAGFSNGAAYADLDNDGDMDLITNNLESPPAIYQNKSASNNWIQIKCKGTAGNPAGLGIKVKVWANGKCLFAEEIQQVRGFYGSVEPMLQVGLGALPKVDKIEIDWQEKRFQILGSTDANQRITFDILNAQLGQCPREGQAENPIFTAITDGMNLGFRHIESDFEDFDREKLLPYRLSRSGPCIAQGDVNGDGIDDLYLGGAAGQSGVIYTFDGLRFSKTAQMAFDADQAAEDTGAAFADIDQDNDLDLYVVSGSNEWTVGSTNYQDRLYLNDGKGNFTKAAAALPKETESGICVKFFDYDKDGWPDLFVGGGAVPGRYPESAESMILHNEKGVFKNVTAQVNPSFQRCGLVQDLELVDLQKNGSPCLVVCGDWMPIQVYQWNGTRFMDNTAALHLGNSSGWWNCLQIADLDGDQDLDIIVGNEGLNHRLKASESAPLRLFASDFDKNGSLDPLLCLADKGQYRTVAQRDLLVAQMPSIKKKFQRYQPFAKAGVTDIFSEKELLSGMSLEAKCLTTQWFEQRDGQLIAHDLPLEAQVAPIHSIIVDDFTNDGIPDLLLAGNDDGADIETYQQRACNGLMLRGLGGGQYAPMSGAQTGLALNENVRDMRLLKGKGSKKCLVAAMNNAPVRLFWKE